MFPLGEALGVICSLHSKERPARRRQRRRTAAAAKQGCCTLPDAVLPVSLSTSQEIAGCHQHSPTYMGAEAQFRVKYSGLSSDSIRWRLVWEGGTG